VWRRLVAGIAVVVAACQTPSTADTQPAAQEQPPTTAPCDVADIRLLGDGGDQSWSQSNGLIAYDLRDDQGVYQLRTVYPDGSGDTCLSCTAQRGSPRVDRHKVNPTWHASGRFIVVQGEMDTHPLSWLRENVTSELFINGLWTNLYAVTADGQQWYRLTNYSNTQADGALGAHFSADGTRISWSHMVARASNEAPFGVYRLQIADFVVDSEGVPSLQNVQDVTPAGGTFVEAHGFSPDGQRLIFTGDMENSHTWGMDIYTMDLASGEVTNLTRSPHWDEHASFSPSGRRIAYMSSEPYGTSFLRAELMLRDLDSGETRQLTHFNARGYPESTEEASVAARPVWNGDGTQLTLTQMLTRQNLWRRRLWVLSFAGACGG
jgi:Tol biopolymer transport system component